MAILYKTGIFANYPIETVRPNLPKFSHQHPQNSELCCTQQPWDVDQVCCSKAVQVNNCQKIPLFFIILSKELTDRYTVMNAIKSISQHLTTFFSRDKEIVQIGMQEDQISR